jgi:hypothetical protein
MRPLGAGPSVVIPGCATWRRPGIHNHHREYGFRARAPARPGMTTVACNFAFPRRDAPGFCWKPCPPEIRGRRECRVRAAPAVSYANGEKWVRARAYWLSGGIRHPLRNGFTAYAALSSATNSSCHRRRRIQRLLQPGRVEFVTADLAPATGVRTTRFCRTLQRRSSCAPAIAHEVQLALRPPFAPTLSRPPHPIPRS